MCYLYVHQMLRDDLQHCASAFESIDPGVLSAGITPAEDSPGWPFLELHDRSTRAIDHFFQKTFEGYFTMLP